MKIVVIIIAVIIIAAFVISQVWASKDTKGVEMYPYKVIKTYDQFEIRKYAAANFSYVKLNAKSYKESSGMGFRKLASYIFGGNESNQKIAMTSPVTMNMDDSVTMMFMIPAEYNMNEMPAPKDSSVKFKTEPEKIVAAIQFGGYADDQKIEKYRTLLVEALQAEGIEHAGKFSFLGYNPPYELINRRNEIIVELKDNSFN